MRTFLQKRWFLLALLVLIPAGLAAGSILPAQQAEDLSAVVSPRLITAVVLFLMSFSLDSHKLRDSFHSPAPVLWASTVNFAAIPLMTWALMPLQTIPDFAFGLMIAGSVPCTMAAASVWTRKAGGNDAVSLLVTVLTNGFCFLLTPFWLNWTTAQDVDLDAMEMFRRLITAALLPMLAGQLARRLPRMGALAAKYKTPIGVAAQSCILILVLSAALKAGTRLRSHGDGLDGTGVLLVWGCCIAVHLAAIALGRGGGRLFGFPREDQTAVTFAASQKTLPIGVLIATDPKMFGGLGVPFAVFPMLMYHASQLFIDTLIADRLAAGANKKPQPASLPETQPNP